MKLCVYAIWDMVESPSNVPDCIGGGALYFIEDQETGTRDVAGIAFASEQEAQAYLDTHREEIERKGLPPLSPEDVALYRKVFETTERKLDAGDLQIENPSGTERLLLRLARQTVPLEESSLRRIESVITRLNLIAENARAAAAKSVLDAQETKSRFDLACAYLELGDRAAALCMLDEVVRQGNDAYKDQARKMISEISGKAN